MRSSTFRPDFEPAGWLRTCNGKLRALFVLVLFPLLLLAGSGFAAEDAELIESAAKESAFTAGFVQMLEGTPVEQLNGARDGEGRTMLHWLAARSHQARSLALLLCGVDVNVKDHRGRTPLFDSLEASDAYYKGDADFMVLEMLVVCGADLNLRLEDGTTPLGIAVERGDYRRAEFLLWCGAQPDPVGVPAGKLPLQLAHLKKDQRMISLLESAIQAKADGVAGAPRSLKGNRSASLSEVLTAADLAMLDELMASGWKINEPDEKGRTALLRAVETGRADLANRFLLAGADPNIASKTGKTPLMAGLKFLTIEGQRMNALLLLRGADVEAATKAGVTPLITAVSSGNDFGVLWLLCQGANPLAPTPKGSLMAYAEHPPTAYLLKAFGMSAVEKEPPADPVAAMFEAVKRNDLAGVERALDSGASPGATDKRDCTALDWAISYGRFEIIDLLLKRGASLHRQSKNGSHPLHHLATWGTAVGGGRGFYRAADQAWSFCGCAEKRRDHAADGRRQGRGDGREHDGASQGGCTDQRAQPGGADAARDRPEVWPHGNGGFSTGAGRA